MWMYLKIESSFYPFKHILTIYSSICWCGWTKPCQGAPVARKSCAFAKWRAMTAWDPGNQLEPIAKHVTVGRLGLAMSRGHEPKPHEIMNKHAPCSLPRLLPKPGLRSLALFGSWIAPERPTNPWPLAFFLRHALFFWDQLVWEMLF